MIDRKFVDFLLKNKITAECYFIVDCIYNQKHKKLSEYLENSLMDSELRTCLYNLEHAKFIKADYRIDNLKSIILTDKFYKIFLEDIEYAAEEIWYMWYPKQRLVVQGGNYSTKGIGFEDFVLSYKKITRGLADRHLEIKEITKNYIDSNPTPQMQLKKYIETRYFDDIADDYSKANDDFIEVR
jgi:hypothetical protein